MQKSERTQRTAINRLRKCEGKVQMQAVVISSIYSNFNYYPLVLHFCSFVKPIWKKVENLPLD